MDPNYIKSETTYCNDESNSVDSDDHCHCPVEASEQNNLNFAAIDLFYILFGFHYHC